MLCCEIGIHGHDIFGAPSRSLTIHPVRFALVQLPPLAPLEVLLEEPTTPDAVCQMLRFISGIFCSQTSRELSYSIPSINRLLNSSQTLAGMGVSSASFQKWLRCKDGFSPHQSPLCLPPASEQGTGVLYSDPQLADTECDFRTSTTTRSC